jgi:hypothetical protein
VIPYTEQELLLWTDATTNVDLLRQCVQVGTARLEDLSGGDEALHMRRPHVLAGDTQGPVLGPSRQPPGTGGPGGTAQPKPQPTPAG